jgi:hypothetical protein
LCPDRLQIGDTYIGYDDVEMTERRLHLFDCCYARVAIPCVSPDRQAVAHGNYSITRGRTISASSDDEHVGTIESIHALPQIR